jgi:hypothetical protein
MKITIKICLKWILLVTLSAIASFIAAILTEHNTRTDIFAMLTGIATFILINILLEGWATSRQKSEFIRSLKVAVLIKIGLELLPAIEVTTGMGIVQLVEMAGIKNRFLATYLKTVGTGTVLASIVFAIAAINRYIRNRAKLRMAG